VLELGNNDRPQAFASGQLVDGSWVACHRKSELLAALLPCSATITMAVYRVCAQPRYGLVSLTSALFGMRFLHKFFHLN
jgi:hypothetical protein